MCASSPRHHNLKVDLTVPADNRELGATTYSDVKPYTNCAVAAKKVKK